MAKKKESNEEIVVSEINFGMMEFCVLGRTPFICNRMSEKVKMELLFPTGKKSKAEKAISLKHNPFEEYRNSPYRVVDIASLKKLGYIQKGEDPYLAHVAPAFKKAIASMGLDIPGTNKKQMLRLLWVEGERIPIYGIPKLFMAVVRCADQNRTPDIRTRAIISEWACRVIVKFAIPILNETTVTKLFCASGIMQGVGDWRNEKGSGTYGQFELVQPNDHRFLKIIKEGGKKEQEKALKYPEMYDDETANLIALFQVQATQRGIKGIK